MSEMQGLFQNRWQGPMFILKIDNLQKHAKRKKALVVVLGICDVGEYYMNNFFFPCHELNGICNSYEKFNFQATIMLLLEKGKRN
jgi:hypothetical protein